MARKRMIDPGFWMDEKIAELPVEARLLFIGMWNFADDEGILGLRPEYIKSIVFPYDDYTKQQIDDWIGLMIKKNFIFPYSVSGQQYGIILNFLKHQVINKPVLSKLPKPSIQNSKYAIAIHERDGWFCHLCGMHTKQALHDSKSDQFPSLDHLIPVSKGGSDMPNNLLTACIKCNKSRGNADLPDNYRSATGYVTHQEKRREVKRSEKKRNEYTESFEEFWKLYPKKVGKPKSFEFWNDLSEQEHKKILEDVPKRGEDSKWINGFVKDPERYLKYRQWEDDIIKPTQKAESKGADKF